MLYLSIHPSIHRNIHLCIHPSVRISNHRTSLCINVPILWVRSIACISAAGFHQGSIRNIRDATYDDDDNDIEIDDDDNDRDDDNDDIDEADGNDDDNSCGTTMVFRTVSTYREIKSDTT